MEIQMKKRERDLLVSIVGDIDHHTSEEIRDKIDKEYERKTCKNIIFDFAGVSFMDSSGIGMVMGRYKRAQKNGGQVSITNMSDDINRIFTISGLQKIVGVE